MKISLLVLVLSFLQFNLMAQDIVVEFDTPNPDESWPFLWDLEIDEDGNLYTVSERGKLYVKREGQWNIYTLNMNETVEARSLAIDPNGVIWIATKDDGLYKFENEEFTNYNTINSFIPSNDCRVVRIHNGDVWIAMPGKGISRFRNGNFTNFSRSNSSLDSDYIYNMEVTQNNKLIVAEGSSFYTWNDNTSAWDQTDLSGDFGFSQRINDIFVTSDLDIYFATSEGLSMYSNNTYFDLSDKYGDDDFSRIFVMSNNDIWACEIFEGMHFIRGDEQYYFESQSGVPSQAFDMIEHNDSLKIIGNVGSSVVTLFVDGLSELNELPDLDVKIYPNPVQHELNIEMNNLSNYSLNLLDINGRRIFEITKPTTNISELSSGVYFLKITDRQSGLIKIVELIK